MIKKGFITIATGKEEYYILAANLLRSYRFFAKEPLPFAILCDRDNEYTKEFDQVILYENGAANSYLDKLELADYAPYDETIFIDADCLAYGDLNKIFEYFKDADSMSCFGRVLPLEDKTGWFEYENLGELKSRVSYIVGLHGGIYYIRKDALSKKVFADARSMIPDYKNYKFKGKFDNPGDEPLVALSMALNQCHPVPFQRDAICCYWEYERDMELDITVGQARILRDPKGETRLVHWGTRFTRELEYQMQIALLDLMLIGHAADSKEVLACKKHYKHLILRRRCKSLITRINNKIKRTIRRELR